MDEKLSYKLYEDMHDLYKKIKKFYNPTRFFQMLTDSKGDGYGVILKLMEKNIHYGFKKLWKKGKLNLSVEALIVEEYKDVIPSEIVEKFEKRLTDCGYIPKKKH